MKKFEVGKSYKSNKLGRITVIKRTAQFVMYTRKGTRYDGQTFRSKIRVCNLGEYISANDRDFFAAYEIHAPETAPAETDTASETASEPVSEPETGTNATVKAAIARLTRRVKRETGDNIRDCFEAIAEEHDAASEAIAAMEKEADDYINAVTARFCADGTEVEPETADENETNATDTPDDNKAAAMTAQEVTARKMIAEQTTEYLLKTWEDTTENNDPFIPTVRGWLMDELQSRYPEAYDKWLDSEVCEDAALREYINAEIQAEQDATDDKEETQMTMLDVHTMNLSATEDEEIFSVKVLWNDGDSWIEYADTAEKARRNYNGTPVLCPNRRRILQHAENGD